jgi:hypothetical protein
MVIYLFTFNWNVACARLISHIIRLHTQFPDYPIKIIWPDNACEFTSQEFNNFCIFIGIDVEHSVAHVYIQNGLAESFIKWLQLIARLLLMKPELPTSICGHVILHVASLVRIRPSAYHKYSLLQLDFGIPLNIFHLWTFSCVVYVPVTPL